MSNENQPTLLVIDGHSLAFRAFYALPVDSFQTSDGQHTNAIHGFIAMLINLLKAEKPTHIAVAFDISRYSFRTREYPEYKGTRGETPPEFIGQIPLLQEALAAMNITTITVEDYEADDILATLATTGSAAGYRVLVVSGDRDTIQLVNDEVTLLYPSRQGVSDLTRYDPAKVQERYGIRPEQYPDVAALVGETSDNLPGVPKVGEKTAVKWLGIYGSLDGILENAEAITGKVGESLREHKDRAVRNRRLNRLVTDLALPVELSSLARSAIDEEAVRDIFARLQFRTLLDRLLKTEGIDPSASQAGSATPTSAPERPEPQRLLDEELRAWIERNAASGCGIALTADVVEGRVVDVALSTAEQSVELAWQLHGADYAPFEEWLTGDSPVVMAGAKSLIKAFHRSGLEVAGPIIDVELLGWVLRPGSPEKDLAGIARRYLGEDLPVGDPNQLIASEGSGLAVDAWFLSRLAPVMREALDEGSLRVFDDIEVPVLPVLAEMELAGVAVSHDELHTLSTSLGDRAADLAAQAYAEIGREVNLGSPKQLQEVLFDQLGMPKTRANKTGYSTDAGALADLQAKSPHPFLGLLLQHRDATKLRQIVESLDKAIAPDGRIHTTYGQIGASTGRLSSTDPNLQNIPIRSEEGRRIRSAFHAGEGMETLLTADYSQIEMRIMAHLSGDPGLIQAFKEGEDLHRFVGARIFGVDPSDVTPEMRSKVKAMSYGLAYGLSAFGLSKQLRIESSEAKKLMSDYFERFGAVRDYLRHVVEQAKTDGYTTTIFGRRRPFPELSSPNRVVRENAERAALNAPIQGSAADIMKIAMVRIADEMRTSDLRSRMLLQVHDELVFDVAPGETDTLGELVTRHMSGAAELSVPLDVQLGVGTDWNTAGH
ncbi:DNA polymerase I [Mycetocola reblochoni]|uniref:DNA polymerase I n=2 Tax=Mycetocola reblochoni TaxID=331618 RepID=A0A1R4J4W2_9MICO|nr:DNA polymerase I [Mycetocola reblochoni]RLP69536.1 DNA polymerase I [Mycetocola reblochoni]SJN26984.1 DNA polymerase I [Mycetocola reblochoni REB411]